MDYYLVTVQDLQILLDAISELPLKYALPSYTIIQQMVSTCKLSDEAIILLKDKGIIK